MNLKPQQSNGHLESISSIKRVEIAIFKELGLNISNLETDLECIEYVGHNFNLNTSNIKFRKAKITPKKIGQFVTLWKRNEKGETEPFDITDSFDFYMIAVEKEEEFGLFIFPKAVLSEKQILTNTSKTGKRGFRIYAEWDFPESKQAKKTKSWQMNFLRSLFSFLSL